MRIALLGLAVAVLSIGLPATGVITPEQGWLLTGLAVLMIIIALLPPPITRAVTKRLPWMGGNDRAREALVELIGSANQLHERLRQGGPDDHLDQLVTAWYVAAQGEVQI